MSEKRANRVLGIAVTTIAIIAVIVVLAVKEPTAELDKSSPEGVVQQYLSATIDRDFEQAKSFLASDSKCSVDDFERAYVQDSLRIGLSDTTETASSAKITVKIETSNGDPFGNTYTETQIFQLVKDDSEWKIASIPWPMYECGGEYK